MVFGARVAGFNSRCRDKVCLMPRPELPAARKKPMATFEVARPRGTRIPKLPADPQAGWTTRKLGYTTREQVHDAGSA